MLDEKKTALHASRHPSLLPLRIALSLAESGSPSRPPRMDVNEQLALQLIEKMKTSYKKPQPFLNWNDIPSQHGFRESLQKMAVSHA